MSKTRMSFVQIIRQSFSDETVKERCLLSVRKNIRNDISGRMFDNFPPFLEKTELNKIAEEFKKIILKVESINTENDKFLLTNKVDKENIVNWEKRITEIACQELLDERGDIKDDIIELLEFDRCKKMPTRSDLVHTYLVAIIQQVTKLLSDVILKKGRESVAAVNHHMNITTRKVVLDALKEKGFYVKKIPEEKEEQFSEIEMFTWLQVTPPMGMAVGLGAAALLGLGLHLLFKPANNKEKELNDGEHRFSPSREYK